VYGYKTCVPLLYIVFGGGRISFPFNKCLAIFIRDVCIAHVSIHVKPASFFTVLTKIVICRRMLVEVPVSNFTKFP
jgi:hypothetical protein